MPEPAVTDSLSSSIATQAASDTADAVASFVDHHNQRAAKATESTSPHQYRDGCNIQLYQKLAASCMAASPSGVTKDASCCPAITT